jgi:anthranilate phosphoribosyltransferase
MLLRALSGQRSAALNILALNAGAAIYTAGLADSHEQGVRRALELISSGAPKAKLDQFIAFTNSF